MTFVGQCSFPLPVVTLSRSELVSQPVTVCRRPVEHCVSHSGCCGTPRESIKRCRPVWPRGPASPCFPRRASFFWRLFDAEFGIAGREFRQLPFGPHIFAQCDSVKQCDSVYNPTKSKISWKLASKRKTKCWPNFKFWFRNQNLNFGIGFRNPKPQIEF